MKTIIVTGAAGNLAGAVLHKLLDSGYQVLATVREGTAAAAEAHPQLIVFPVNASDAEAVRKFVTEASEKYGPIEGLVQLVGGYAGGKIGDATMESIHSMMALNFETAFHYVKPMLHIMKQQQAGRIILVGSRPGKYPKAAKNSVAYGLAKSLLFRLAEIINVEGTEMNVKATVIVPGTIDTPSNRKAMPNADFSKWNNPDDIASTMEAVLAGRNEREVIEFTV